MTRWNIRKIVLYSRDGQRRDIDLEPGKVNIITGPSHTGKSAIVEIIDYCMGSGECHIPGVVRDAVSWVGLLWERGSEQFAAARPIPPPSRTTVDEMFWQKGRTGASNLLPERSDAFQVTGTRNDVMLLIEKSFGIGQVSQETLNPQRPGVRISARAVVPYVLVDDDVIISKSTLLRGANDERRQSIVDSMPYFLGVIDERTAGREAELRRLQHKFRLLERSQSEVKAIASAEGERAAALLAEAAEVGLIQLPTEPLPLNETITLLSELRGWTPGTNDSVPESPLTNLYANEAAIRSRLNELRSQIRSSERLLASASEFGKVAAVQARHLEHVNLFKKQVDRPVCPLCESELSEMVPTTASIRAVWGALAEELREVNQDRPKLDRFLISLRDDFAAENERLQVVRFQIEAAVAQIDGASARIDLDHRRSRIVGRISLYIESVRSLDADTGEETEGLRRQIEELEQELDIEGKKERLAIAEQRVSNIASRLISDLPFEREYRDSSVYLLSRRLECGISTDARRIPMRDVGSDENYLSLHVSLLAAFHRFFKQSSAPVPGVLLFDQLSRPYYPPERRPGEVVLKDTTEAPSLHSYFEFLFKETKSQRDLQIIVLEHAYLESSPTFISCVVERWTETEKLIPSSWLG